jgi:hypothetical protein
VPRLRRLGSAVRFSDQALVDLASRKHIGSTSGRRSATHNGEVMQSSRIAGLVTFTAILAATARALSADAPQPPNDPAAEQILRQARDAVGKLVGEARRLEIDCEHSDLDHRFKSEERYRARFYLERQVGCLLETQPMDLTGQTSRVRTNSGHPYRLASPSALTTLYRDGVPTWINPQSHTYEIIKADYFTYETVKGDSVSPLKGVSQPADFSATVLPHPLHRFTSWETIRSDYRIQQCPSTPTTVCIALSRRSVNAGYDKLHHEHHEIVLDRSTLLPKSWRLVYGEWDRLTTYNRFDLNPKPRELKVPPGYSEGDTSPSFSLFSSSVNFKFDVATKDPGSPQAAADAKVSEKADTELAADVLLVEATYCVLRLLHLF